MTWHEAQQIDRIEQLAREAKQRAQTVARQWENAYHMGQHDAYAYVAKMLREAQ